MFVNVFARQVKARDSEYSNTYFSVQGVNLNGTVPIRVCYFGRPVMEPKMIVQVDPITKKPKLDEKGKEILVEEKNEQGEPVLVPKKDENGEEILRDENYSARMDLLVMYSGNLEDGTFCEPVKLIAKPKQNGATVGGRYNYFLVCGNENIPVEVPDFSTDEKPDYRYSGNCRKLYSMAEKV